MSGWTQEELEQFRILRREDQEASAKHRAQWTAARPGYCETETIYMIEYRNPEDDMTWYGAAPFYIPMSVRPEETRSREEAEKVAALLLAGSRGTARTREPVPLAAVRLIEYTTTARIIQQF